MIEFMTNTIIVWFFVVSVVCLIFAFILFMSVLFDRLEVIIGKIADNLTQLFSKD